MVRNRVQFHGATMLKHKQSTYTDNDSIVDRMHKQRVLTEFIQISETKNNSNMNTIFQDICIYNVHHAVNYKI